MKGLILLVAAFTSAVMSSENNHCVGQDELVTPFLADKANLLCRDGSPITTSNSQLCSTADGFKQERNEDFYVLCEDTFKLIGYTKYLCLDGDLATALIADEVMSPYSACVAADVAVCSDVQSPSALTKLYVHSDTPVDNVALETAETAAAAVNYKLLCEAGYSFKSGVEGNVYGYCSGVEGGNAYAFKDDAADGCYSVCPANGAVSSDVANLKGIVVSESKNEDVKTVAVECAEGFDLVQGAAETYTFTCEGALQGEANGGSYTCVDCPVCVVACPENAAADQIDASPSNLVSIVAAEASAGQSFLAGVNCAEGFSLAGGAPLKYEFRCKDAEEEVAGGIVALKGDVAPVCLSKCAGNSDPNKDSSWIENYVTMFIDEAASNEQKDGAVKCNSGFAVAYNIPKSKFMCKGAADEAASKGEFHCIDKCPVCEKVCAIPTDDEVFAYGVAVGAIEDNQVPAGPEHVVMSCIDEALSLVGERFLSCKDGELVFDNEEKAVCADAVVCEAPKVTNAVLDNNDNKLIGAESVYKVTCQPGHFFDVYTAENFGTKKSYYEASVTCTEETQAAMPAFTCYAGCLAPDFQGGVVYPDIKTENAAPFAIGEAVTFACLDDQKVVGGAEKAEAVCDAGGIPSPICGSGAMSFVSSLTVLFISLIPFLL